MSIVGTLAAIIPAAIGVWQLIEIRKGVADVQDATVVAARARHVQEIISHSLPSFTATALEFSPEERVSIFRETDRKFGELNQALLALRNVGSELIPLAEQQMLSDSIENIAHSWEEIRENAGTNMAPAEKTFHFLKVFADIRKARNVLVKVEQRAEAAANLSTTLSRERIQHTYVLLVLVICGGALISLLTISGSLEFAKSVRESNERLDAALSNMTSALTMFDRDQKLVISNGRFGEMFAIPSEELQPGISLQDVVTRQVRNGYFEGDCPDSFIREYLAKVSAGTAFSQTLQLADGRTIAVSQLPMKPGGWVTTHTDISEIRRIEAEIEHIAHHDALTDLPNRVTLRKRAGQILAQLEPGKQVAVMCLDLDRFKLINDSYGHAAGDELLKSVADRLRQCTRRGDVIARLGGDEFAIITQPDTEPHNFTIVAERICEALSKPFQLPDQQVVSGVSIGIAVSPKHGTDIADLLKNADMALYKAKSDGRGVYRYFESEMDARMRARCDLEVDLRKALNADQFELHYQPIVNIETGSISGFEALIRWHHAERGFILPSEFIPIAEEANLIVPIGEWAIRTACHQAAKWPKGTRVAVNLSAVQFRSDRLVDVVSEALESSGLSGRCLELEITENVLMEANEATLEKLHDLRFLGVRIVMDDFGTGYSSLSYLRSFPFDKIKLDKSFIGELASSDGSDAILTAVASMSKSLGINTTAEGVETEREFNAVKSAGYTEMQGYFFSPPRSVTEINELYLDACNANKAVSAVS